MTKSIDFFAKSQAGARGHLASVNRRRAKAEKKWSSPIRKALQIQIDVLASQLRRGATISVPSKPMREVLDMLYFDVGTDFAALTMRGIREETKSHEPGHEEETDEVIAAYIAANVGDRIEGMNEYTERVVSGVIQDGRDEGLSREQTAAGLLTWWVLNEASRTAKIAQTEVLTGTEAGIDAAVNTIDRPVMKFWQTTFQNSRDTHIAAHNKKRKKDEPFDVGGSRLMFPGDGSLGAAIGELANCHCSRYFEIQ